jgi:predicted deacylase
MTDLLTHPLPAAPAAPPRPAPEVADLPAGALSDSVAHDLAVVVAPSTGRFRTAVEPGSRVGRGALLGHVTGGGGRADVVRAPVAGVVADLLARPKQLVHRGDGLAWLQRTGAAEAA